MRMIYFIIGIGYLIDIIFIVHDAKKHDGLSVVLKTLAAACFVCLSIILCKTANSQELARYIVYALIFDLFGDFVLILRNVTNKHHDLIFILGTFCFFVGHIFLMIMLFKNNPNVVGKSLVYTTIVFALFGLPLLFKFVEASKKFKIIGGVYVYFIIYIQVYGLLSLINLETKFDYAFLFGYFLFAVSDLILIIQKFNKNASYTLQPIYRLSYFISQVIIALSIAYL